MARTPQRQQAKSDLTAFRGRQTTNTDDAGSDGLADDPIQQRGVIAAQTRGGDVEDGDAGGGEPRERKTAVQVGDEKRNAIFKKFNDMRIAASEDNGEGDDADQGNGLDGNVDSQRRPDLPPRARDADADAGGGEGETGGDDVGDDDKGGAASTFELEVDGQKVNKSLEELEVLSGLTAEEIQAKPQLAIRFAQRELASQARLDRAKKIVRDTTARARAGSEEADDDPGRSSARNQSGNTGSQDDPDRQGGTRNTSEATDPERQLVEDIQIGSPEEVGAKLREYVAKEAKKVAASVVSESQLEDALSAEDRSRISAMRSVVEDHPEIRQNEALVDALTGRIQREYRKDLRKAMIAEGSDPDEADAIIAQASQAQILHAHRLRVVRRDPHVRMADKAFFDGIYKDVTSSFGKGSQQQQERQLLETTRKERKEQLRTQPRRSSVAPATQGQQAPVDQIAMRKAAVADIRKARGLKVR